MRAVVGRWFNSDKYIPHHVVLEARDPGEPPAAQEFATTETDDGGDDHEQTAF